MIALSLLAATALRSGADAGVAVIVHPDRAGQMRREDIARIFLKQRQFWSDGQPIVPLNREAGSPEREEFCALVLGSPSAHFAEYWNQQYFHGVFPPVTLSSSAAVKRYVATDRNAIGYVSVEEVDDSVRIAARFGPLTH